MVLLGIDELNNKEFSRSVRVGNGLMVLSTVVWIFPLVHSIVGGLEFFTVLYSFDLRRSIVSIIFLMVPH